LAPRESEEQTNCFINSLVGGETRTFLGRNAIFQNSTDGSGNQICSAGAGVLTFLGAGSTTLRALGFLGYMGDQFFQINTAVTTESVGIQTMTINGSCQLARSTGDSAAINAGATSILANTSKVTAVSAGGIYGGPSFRHGDDIRHQSAKTIQPDLTDSHDYNQ